MDEPIKGPCVKQEVIAVLDINGSFYYGDNSVDDFHFVCPRDEEGYKSGEGYHLCKTSCKQPHHAEVGAIKNAQEHGADTKDSIMYLMGHKYCCNDCIEACIEAGVKAIYIMEAGEVIKTYDLTKIS